MKKLLLEADQDPDDIRRMGAIYLNPGFRARGLASQAIREFMRTRKGRAFIEDANEASRRAYWAAGFRMKKAVPEQAGAWWENFS